MVVRAVTLLQVRQVWVLPRRDALFGHLQSALDTAQVLALLCGVSSRADSWFVVSCICGSCVTWVAHVLFKCVCGRGVRAQSGVAGMVGPAVAGGFGFMFWPPLMCLITRDNSPTTQLWLQASVVLLMPLVALPVAALSRWLSVHVTWKCAYACHCHRP